MADSLSIDTPIGKTSQRALKIISLLTHDYNIQFIKGSVHTKCSGKIPELNHTIKQNYLMYCPHKNVQGANIIKNIHPHITNMINKSTCKMLIILHIHHNKM